MKKYFSLLLALSLLLSMTACGAAEPEPETAAPTEATSVTEATAATEPSFAPTAPTDPVPTEQPLTPTAPSLPTLSDPDQTVSEPTVEPTLTEPLVTEIPVTEPTVSPSDPTRGPETSAPTEVETVTGTAPTDAVPLIPAVTDPPSTSASTEVPATRPTAQRPAPTEPQSTQPAQRPTAPSAPTVTEPAATVSPTTRPAPTAPAVTEPSATESVTVPSSASPTQCVHSYSVTATRAASCTAAEARTFTCTKCGNSYIQTLGEPLPHSFDDATCTQPKTCSICGAVSGSALGHNYNIKALCTRCGEAESGPIEILVKVKDTRGSKLSNVTVELRFGDSQAPAAIGVTDPNGELRIEVDHLEPYEIRLSNLPANVTAKGSYSFSSKQANINLTAQAVLDPMDHSLADYQRGSTMADFTLSDTEGNSYRLYDLLEEKDLVILDFWYCMCTPCKNEFPYFEAALDRYGSDISLLALNPLDTLDEIIALRQELSVSFPMLRDTVNLYLGFKVTSYPVTVFIGSDGTVLSIHRGAYDNQEQFFKDIDKYL